jgi:hypothetical protein
MILQPSLPPLFCGRAAPVDLGATRRPLTLNSKPTLSSVVTLCYGSSVEATRLRFFKPIKSCCESFGYRPTSTKAYHAKGRKAAPIVISLMSESKATLRTIQ